MLRIAAFVVPVLLIAGCSLPDALPPTATKDIDFVAELARRGYSRIEDRGDVLFVEGDMVFRKSDLRARLQRQGDARRPSFQWLTFASASGPFWEQAADGRPYGCGKICSVVIDLSGIENANGWIEPARAAIAEWNAIEGSYARIYESVDGYPEPDIIATYTSVGCDHGFPPQPCAWAWATVPPGDGNPGNSITVRELEGANAPQSRKLVFAHELGHTIGIDHTDWQSHCAGSDPVAGQRKVPLTDSVDASSVMRACVAEQSWNGFSYWDLFTIRYAYRGYGPRPTVSSDGTTASLVWHAREGANGYRVYRVKKYWPGWPAFPWEYADSTFYHGSTTDTTYSATAQEFPTACFAVRATFPNPVQESLTGDTGCPYDMSPLRNESIPRTDLRSGKAKQ